MSGSESLKRWSGLALGSADRIGAIAASLWKLLSFSLADDRIAFRKNLCVSIEPAAVSFAYGSRLFSRVTIKSVSRQTFGGAVYPTPDEVASAAAVTASTLGAGGSDVTLCIPKAWTVLSTTELPAAVRENLPNVLAYELDRLTPLAAEDAFFDARVRGDREGRITVAIAAARREFVNPYVEALAEKGMTVRSVTPGIAGIGTLLRGRGNGGTSLFLDISAERYEGALFADGEVLAALSGSFPSSDDTARVEAIIAGVEEFRGQLSGSPVFVLLSDQDAALKELLRLRMDAPMTIMKETDLRLSLPGPAGALPYYAIGGLAASLQSKTRALNLLSLSRVETPRTPFALTAILLLLLAAVGVLFVVSPFQAEGKKLAQIDQLIAQKKEEARKIETLKKDVDSLKADIETISQFKDGRPMVLNLVKELTTVLPKTTWLTRVRTTETGVEIEGYASAATELLSKLETSKYFRKVEFASPTFRDARMNADRFIIKMELEGVKKPEPEGAKSGKK